MPVYTRLPTFALEKGGFPNWPHAVVLAAADVAKRFGELQPRACPSSRAHADEMIGGLIGIVPVIDERIRRRSRAFWARPATRCD